MNYKKLLIGFIKIFTITLVVSIGVTYLWNLVFHASPRIDWEISFRLAIILGIVISTVDARKKKM